MKNPSLHDKLIELYLKKEDPDSKSIKRGVENYLHKKYPDNKVQRVVDDLKQRYDFRKESSDIKYANNLAAYIDSIIVGRIRDSYKLSKSLNFDNLEELKFKVLVKFIILHFGYQMLYTPKNTAGGIDVIVHRGNTKVGVLAVKCEIGHCTGIKTIRQARYISSHYKCEKVIIVSSTDFDHDALEEGRELGMTLLNKDKILPLVQDLVDNRSKKERELLDSEIYSNKNSIFLDGQIKFPKSKVQVVFVRYFINDVENHLTFEGELLNTGKMPALNINVEIKIFDRSGICGYKKVETVDKDRLDSNEKADFKLIFDDVPKQDWMSLCRYVLKLDYSNVHMHK